MIVQYSESILAYVSAVRHYLGLTSSYDPEPRLATYLADKKPRNIFLMLIDGMGANLIKRKLPSTAFLNKHMTYQTSTVFPSTTAAATISIQNGKGPNENGWLGWTQYLKEKNEPVVSFLGTGVDTKKEYGADLFYQTFPVLFTDEELCAKGIPARKLYPDFVEGGCATFKEMCEHLVSYSHNGQYRYIYAYWDKYDSSMHKKGVDHPDSDAILRDINSELEKMAINLNDDTLIMIVADHGQLDMHEEINLGQSKFADYFYHRPCIEPRAQAFYVKKEFQKQFEVEFQQQFSDIYLLLNKQQVISSKLFGEKENHPRFEELIGDYVAIAKTDKYFSFNKEIAKENIFKGHHGGMSADEMTIPVITYMK